jgi:aubergine-like protein
MNQPLVEVCLRTEKKIVKGELIKNDMIGYLIPEFISLTGMSDEQRSNYNTMKAIAPYTKLAPHEKMEKTDTIRDILNKGEELVIGDPLKVEGYQLTEPEVKLNSQIFKSKDGTLRFKDRLKTLVSLKDWILVYTTGKNSKYDDEDADNFFSLLQEAAPTYGITISEPGFIACSPNLGEIKQKIDDDIKKNGKPQIIVMLMNPQD